MDEFSDIWIDQCQAARDIREEWGTRKALGYLVGEKLLNYAESFPGQTVSRYFPISGLRHALRSSVRSIGARYREWKSPPTVENPATGKQRYALLR